MGVRITSWNVNGIRNPFSYHPWSQTRTFESMFDILEADIVVLQEMKIQRKDLRDDMVLVPGWDVYYSLPKDKKGYSGVAVYTRNSACAPIRAEEGITGVLCPPGSSTSFADLPQDQQIGGYPRPGQLTGTVDETTLDSEGRCVILEFPGFVLIGTYCPATRDESRDDFRMGYLEALDARVRNLVAMGKRVVLTGDLNIIRAGIDTAVIADRLKKEGMSMADFFSAPSRRLFNQLLFEGSVHGARDAGRETPALWDLGRLFHPARQGMFTCWETKRNARPGNFGSRIDYVLCSDGMKDWFVEADIQEGLLGSDHCPVYATLGDVVSLDGEDVHVRDILNPPGMFRDGKRLRDWSAKDLLPASAKLIPEFDRRRSIKDMFFKKKTAAPVSESDAAATPTGAESTASQQPEASQTSSSHASSTQPATAASKPSTLEPAPTGAKRPSTSTPSTRPPKKAKAASTKEAAAAAASASKGQSSLMGFFKPKPAAPTKPTAPDANQHKTPEAGADNNTDADGMEADLLLPREETEADRTTTSPKRSQDAAALKASAEKVVDPIQSKESWSKLLGGRVPPKCEHGDPCTSMVTKKAGVNRGRSFYMCARPLGPSGEKEKGTVWRCATFIWSSDWNG